MADVARLVGVSEMTVSRVLNGRPRVSAETRARVIAAMSELGYRPNTAARALVTGRSRTLGVVSFNATLYGPASTLSGIEQAAREAGYFVSIAFMQPHGRGRVAEVIDHLKAQAIDGVIISAPHAWTVKVLRHLPADLPVVAIDGEPGPVPSAAVDQYVGAVKATEHLLTLGHETVHHVAGPSGWSSARAREQGWRDALERAGKVVPPALRGDWSAGSGYEEGRRLAASGNASAIFAANDHMALGVLRALQETGAGVPGDVSVVGFDDVPEATFFGPALTTIRQDFGALGQRGLALLVEQIEGASRSSRHVVVEPELVVRDSSGPASASPRKKTS
ncbi:LacI family DNA-binding transcriptional regulator [Actinoallomurus sp. NPDC050550]|uniref:LacI family DNA-binding transcriptional regulator n=1 Tax=Actinoallomurus sp. NPDC050550 TaxID=3154937 RepID=UPI0033E9D96A